jgi:hypothetical protein
MRIDLSPNVVCGKDRRGPDLFPLRSAPSGREAQLMGRIDAENLDLARKESELLERQRQWPILGMGFDIGIICVAAKAPPTM